MTVTAQDKVDLIRAAGLIGRRRAVLSDFEAELVDACVLRFRDRGDGMSLTNNERLVLADAMAAMEDHPFAWLRREMTVRAWASWIEPLSLDEVDQVPVIWGPSELVLTQAQDLAGAQIRRRFGTVAWAVRP